MNSFARLIEGYNELWSREGYEILCLPKERINREC